MGRSSRRRKRGGRRGTAQAEPRVEQDSAAQAAEPEAAESAVATLDPPEASAEAATEVEEPDASVAALARAVHPKDDEPEPEAPEQSEPELSGSEEEELEAVAVPEPFVLDLVAAEAADPEQNEPEIWAPPPLPAAAPADAATAEPAASGGQPVLLGQLLLGLSLALFSEDVQQLAPWGGAGGSVLATALLLPAIVLLFGPISRLVEDFRQQAPGLGLKASRALGLMAVGGGLALALVGLAGNMASSGVTSESAAAFVRDWSTRSGVNARREGSNNLYHFAYTLTLENGFPVRIQRTKGRESYLVFSSEMRLGSDHRRAFESMPQQSQTGVVESLSGELAGQGVQLRMEPPATIHLEVLTPINALSDAVLNAKLAEMRSALSLTRNAVQKHLR